MKTTRLLIIIMAGLLLPFATNAQLGKLMNEFHGNPCVTITQLDKALYGLYKKDRLSPDIEQMLQKLDEVNFLNLDLNECNSDIQTKVTKKFGEKLNTPGEYKLIKSMTETDRRQLIYAKTKDSKVTDLVVWNQNPERLDIIEVKGDIQLNKIAGLSKALNIKGLHSLAALNPGYDKLNISSQLYTIKPMKKDMQQINESLKKMAEKMKEQGTASFSFWSRDSMSNDWEDGFYSFPFGNMAISSFVDSGLEDYFQSVEVEDIPYSFGVTGSNGVNITSSSVEVTEENGKTKIKVDSKNSDMTYIIDGKECKSEKVTMPDQIKDVYIQQKPGDMKKSYLFITSKDKIGQFTGYKDGILSFKYDNQEYKFNLNKSQSPLLMLNGQSAAQFTVNPESILQIRPVSPIEKEAGKYKTTEVIINTK